MVLGLDSPPLPGQQTAAVPIASPTPARTYAHKHPPYAEMITAAILALKERKGSSKRAITKYIGDHYSGLPSTHEALLSCHLRRLKINGQLLMVKHSYKLPRSAPVSGIAVIADPASAGPKRRPGRPPKPKSDVAQVAFPVFQPLANTDSMPVVASMAKLKPEAAAGTGNGPSAAVQQPLRGRGRPPKLHGLKRPPGHQPNTGGGPSRSSAGRGRGRPRLAAPPVQVRKGVQGAALGALGVGAPLVVNGGVGPVKLGRGRPPKAGGVAKRARNLSAVRPKKPRKLSGKPLGRPRKDLSGDVNRAPGSQLLAAYLDLKSKLETLQSRIGQMANFIKPSLNNEGAINALQELELFAANITNSPPSD